MFHKIMSLFQKHTKPDIIVRETDSSLQIHLCVNDEPKAKMACVIKSDNSILIGDISNESGAYCKGYGSLLMNELISYARRNGHTYLFGNLSVVDMDHADRLHHFYEKFGFTVTIYDEQQGLYYGKIEKWLGES